MRLVCGVILGILFALSIAACGGTTNTAATGAAADSTTTTSLTTSVPTTTLAVDRNLRGFGDTDAQWNATHTADPGGPSGVGYLPNVLGLSANTDEWVAASHSNGRIDGWTEVFPEGTTEAGAKQAILDELPTDAVTTSFQKVTDSNGTTCVFWGLRSASIHAALGSDAPSGDVGIELWTAAGDGTAYNPNNVDTATLDTVAIASGTAC